MTTKTIDSLIPSYIKDFSCIGSSCEDTCCSGWKVNVDEVTYKKYKREKNYEMMPRLEKNIIRNRSNPNKNNVARIKMENGKCSFLSKEGWCDIQSKLGEDFLCNTCAVYPRISNKVNGIVEQSLTLSCPEASRLVLLNQNGIDFEKGQHSLTIRGLYNIINTSNEEVTHWTDLFNEYRYITIYALQNRNYSLEERLLILGVLYNELEESVTKNNIGNIPNILGEYLKGLEDNEFKGAFHNVSKRTEIQLQMCRELVVFRLNKIIASSRYLECSREMMIGLGIENGISNKEIQDNFENAYNIYYAPFMLEHDYMLENYLVNYVFKNYMPLDNTSPFESYARMVLHYALIKFHLIGMANYHKGLNKDLVVKLIQSLSKTFEHNFTYFDDIIKLIKENKMMDLTYMSILVKH